ncbi:type IV pilin protein [Pseudoalteromonas sp. MMG013]|nr:MULTISPECIES: type IV pilin protein [unclassified Pseudoalteromonas]MBQ4844208.1 type IV pilin protein [Pseudoalteromonas sp. MMG005]MBQ4861289.1 type IV pilin protein [Pseudoalteromonas sp. MMG013]
MTALSFVFGVFVQLRLSKGFTLTELLISVLIVAVLGSLAMPSYFEYVQESRRSEAQQKMLQVAALLERIYSRNGGYPDSSQFNITLTTQGYNFKYLNQDKPQDGGNFRSRAFTLSAVAIAGGPQITDRCGTLTLNHQGVKGAVSDDCW